MVSPVQLGLCLMRRLPKLLTKRFAVLVLADTALAWAAQEGRILLTHDVATSTRYAYERVTPGQLMPGVLCERLESSYR